MNGILNIYKPQGITSFGVISFLRKNLGIKKMGHLGTLDPDATGVLPVCIGNATKAVEFLMDKDKSYKVKLKLGVKTDTADATGNVIETKEVNCSNKQIRDCLLSFKGNQTQVPPMYSALKVDGKKLCDLARRGEVVERKKRNIMIYDIRILKIEGSCVCFEVDCSKGTYIRTLCEDVGDRLFCGGHMKELERTCAGEFHLSNALTLDKVKFLKEQGKLEERLVRVDECFLDYPKVILGDTESKKFLNGLRFRTNLQEDSLYRVYEEKVFLGLGEAVRRDGELLFKSRKLF